MEIDWGAGFVRTCFAYLNVSFAIGLIFAAMLLLRPVLMRVLTPRQRVFLWGIGWELVADRRILDDWRRTPVEFGRRLSDGWATRPEGGCATALRREAAI